jgi:RNA polymerase sigma-54 factor
MGPGGMRFDPGHSLRLGQKLSTEMRLTPRLIQSMEILQMPLAQLSERISQELERNVALEVVEPGMDLELGGADGERGARLELDLPRDDADGEAAAGFERLRQLERGYGELFSPESPRAARRDDGEPDGKSLLMANAPSRGESLVEQLRRQWTFAEPPPDLLGPGLRILDFVNDDGMLDAPLATVLEQSPDEARRGGWTPELLERALASLQAALEPVGLAARSPHECILLQIDDRIRRLEAAGPDPAGDAQPYAAELAAWRDARTVVADRFEDLLQNRLPKIAEKLKIPLDRVQRAKTLLRRLDPNPGRELVTAEERPIVPDVIVEWDPANDRYEARLLEGTLPSLRVVPGYEKMVRDVKTERPTREFVAKGVRDARWIIDAIEQRKLTLLRVVQVVLDRQREFLDHGPQFLKPLPMVEVADRIGVHVATVSRAVAGKWMQTPRGLVELRKCFSGGIETAEGEDRSWDAVKAALKELVDAEDRRKPFSDQALADALAARGMTIARRTVVKYREQMGIPPARRRREHGG